MKNWYLIHCENIKKSLDTYIIKMSKVIDLVYMDHVAQWRRHSTSDRGIAGSSPVMVDTFYNESWTLKTD